MSGPNWETHGMVEDREVVLEACNALGLFPDEVAELVTHARFEKDLHLQLAKPHVTPKREDRERHIRIAGYYERRARRLKELEAELERDLTSTDEYQEGRRGS